MGFGVAGVDAQEVFHHSLQGWPKPKKQLSTDQQRNLLVKAKLLDFSAKRGRASGTATEPANRGNATGPTIAKACDLAKFFLWDADFQTYNEKRMTAHDPKSYKWSTGKKLFDYTPHVTKEDWLNALSHERLKESRKMRSYESDGAMTGIRYNGFYQHRMDKKSSVDPLFFR